MNWLKNLHFKDEIDKGSFIELLFFLKVKKNETKQQIEKYSILEC